LLREEDREVCNCIREKEDAADHENYDQVVHEISHSSSNFSGQVQRVVEIFDDFVAETFFCLFFKVLALEEGVCGEGFLDDEGTG
jgi:hypothetical protein